MELKTFIKDMFAIHKLLPYYHVDKDTYRYVVKTSAWSAGTDDFDIVAVELGNYRLVAKELFLLDGNEVRLCEKDRCLSTSGVKVRIGAMVLAYYSALDMLPTSCTRKKLLRYISKAEEDPDLAEFAAVALSAKSTLSEAEVDRIRKAMLREISSLRLVKYV